MMGVSHDHVSQSSLLHDLTNPSILANAYKLYQRRYTTRLGGEDTGRGLGMRRTVKTILDSNCLAMMSCLASHATSHGVCPATFCTNSGAPWANRSCVRGSCSNHVTSSTTSTALASLHSHVTFSTISTGILT